MRITGVIQAGGRSVRMGGRPKALMELGGRRIIDRVADVVRAVADDALIVTDTPELYASLGLPTVSDAFPEHGSLGGVYSGLRAASAQAAEDLVRAIREIYTGEVYLSPAVAVSVVDAYLGRANASEDPLTPRERQILQLVAEGKTTKAIAGLLGISFKTAESHRNRAMQKLDIHDVAGLTRYAIRRGLVHV